MDVPVVKFLRMKAKTGIPGMEMPWCARPLMWTRILSEPIVRSHLSEWTPTNFQVKTGDTPEAQPDIRQPTVGKSKVFTLFCH